MKVIEKSRHSAVVGLSLKKLKSRTSSNSSPEVIRIKKGIDMRVACGLIIYRRKQNDCRTVSSTFALCDGENGGVFELWHR